MNPTFSLTLISAEGQAHNEHQEYSM